MSFQNHFFKPGHIIIVLGNPGVGKTHGITWFAHQQCLLKQNVIANIPMFNQKNIPKAKQLKYLDPDVKYVDIPENYHYVSRASEMILKSLNNRKNMIIVDEAGITASSSKALSNNSVQMKFLGFSIRKIGGCLVIIAQDETSVVPTLRANIVTYKVNIIAKPNGRRDMEILKADKIFNANTNKNEVKFVHHDYRVGIPKVKLPYDTLHPGGFIWDINLEQLYNRVAELTEIKGWDSIDMREHMKDIVKDMVADKKINDFMKRPHFMQSGKVAQIFGVTPRTIRNWAESGEIKAEKDGKNNWYFPIKEVKKKAIELGINFSAI